MSPARAVARVDLGAVRRNCAALASRLTDGAALCAVVKADAYGHGVAPGCAAAAVEGGASMLAVATAEEARELRASGLEVPILTMGALSARELDVALGAGSEVAVWDGEFLELVATRGSALGVRPRVHVKYDTGMGRLGHRDPRAVTELVRRAAGDDRVEAAAAWTHFATADEPGSRFFDEQLRRFRELGTALRAELPGLALHAANSAATLRDAASHLDMVRCGIGIYGLDPFQEDPTPRGLEPALELRSYVAAVKPFHHGDSAGYGQLWRAQQQTNVAVLPIGYGDGVRRGLTNNGSVLIGGRRHPIVGTVSMDNITVDLGADTDVAVGDEAALIGTQGSERILCEEVARRLATINYEVTCGISSRVPREHHGV